MRCAMKKFKQSHHLFRFQTTRFLLSEDISPQRIQNIPEKNMNFAFEELQAIFEAKLTNSRVLQP